MADWMTPRDFELLRGTADKPAIDALIASNAAPSQSAVQITEGSVPVALGRAGGPLGSFGESASSTAPANNPYLADLPNVTTALAPALPPAALEFATPVPTNSPAALILPGPEALPETQTSTPLDELRKARDDERYFKQLKRF
jgi:hypothetical protein